MEEHGAVARSAELDTMAKEYGDLRSKAVERSACAAEEICPLRSEVMEEHGAVARSLANAAFTSQQLVALEAELEERTRVRERAQCRLDEEHGIAAHARAEADTA